MKETKPMNARRRKWRVWVAVGGLLIACEPAHGFSGRGGPGSKIPVEQAPPPPPKQPAPPTAPPEQPGVHVPPVPTGPEVPVDKPPLGPPTQTPEPATG